MRQKLYLFKLLLLAANFLSAELKFDSTSLDLSDQKSKQLIGTFTFVNTSNKTITIKDLKSTCGCINAKAEKNSFKANERGVITVKLPNPLFSLRKHIRVIAGGTEIVLALTVKRKSPTNAPKKTLSPQTFCPYMGLKIKKEFKYVFKGTTIFTCCKECLAAVKVDPEQAIKNLSYVGQRPMTPIELNSFENDF